MDTYYSGLARSVLSDAEAKVAAAQGYLVEAGAPEHLHRSARRALADLRRLQDDILRFNRADKEAVVAFPELEDIND